MNDPAAESYPNFETEHPTTSSHRVRWVAELGSS